MVAPLAAARIVRLKRGGTVVMTSAGAVQFGAPPETIKDALNAGLEVPAIFVMPSQWFSRRRGVTVAELEFPVYYNFFVLGRRVRVVCDDAGRRRLRAILQESLFGPEHIDPTVDYEPSVPAGARADLAREAEWFKRSDGKHIELDHALEFTLFDADGRARLGAVVVERLARGWRVSDGGVPVAEVADEEPAPTAEAPAAPVLAASSFTPPAFGLTVLGSSHGFDPRGKTTGFVLWVNHKGVLVDPPCDTTDTLRAAGVPPRTVDAVVLTHCHADHDAGVFQKILEAERVNLYTTPTILGSFLRKYVAMTGEPEERLRRLFVFRPVTIGGPLRIHGGEFRFHYTLHSIPTIGFECYFGGKSFYYSADTLYDPERVEAMHREGTIGAARRDALVRFPWHHSLIVHEAGVPPIHTPAARLAELPASVKQRLRIIHIAEDKLPAGSGLKLARTGFEHTLTMPVVEHRYAEALRALDALAAVDLFRDFTVERCREFLTLARQETRPAGALVIGQGEAGDRFYIILNGQAAVVKDGSVVKSYGEGDFFGEAALVTGAPRSADVRARTDLTLLAIDKYDFLSFLRGTDLAAALVRLAQNRDLPSWDLICENEVLRTLPARQKTALQAILEHRKLDGDQILWSESGAADAAWLLDSAVVELQGEAGHVPLGRAAFLGDVEAILRRRRLASRAVVLRGGTAFRIEASRLVEFLEHSPGLLLSLSGAQFVP